MRTKILPLFIFLYFFIKPAESIAQVNTQDSLALVDFYNSTNGPNWTNIHWNLNEYVEYWEGVSVDFQTHRVIEIRLENQNISGAIPESFGNLTDLTRLDLNSNRITNLPSSFGKLVNLIHLGLGTNQISSIPSGLDKLVNLTEIDFQSNLLTGEIPNYFAQATNLERLFLAYNNFTGKIPEYFGDMTKLTTLYLRNNKLGGHIPIGLASFEKPMVGGMYLEISNCQFTFADIESFAKIIQERMDSSGRNYAFIYSPQSAITLQFDSNILSVSPGGTYANNTIKWYKNSFLIATNNGDTTYSPDDSGFYRAEITNSVATDLNLSSDSLFVNFQLANNGTTAMQNIQGTSPVDINKGIIKIVSVTPTAGPNALSGYVTATVTIDPTVKTYNDEPYVLRHYDITPETNAANAKATLVLYFTQQDFDNYNNYITTNGLGYPLLPTGGTDNGNVRISQFHGSFSNSPDPENYNGEKILINPDVQWDAANNWWTVSFPVNGFSGFFVNTGNFVLPLSFINFNGKIHQGKVNLQWITENENTTKEYIVQRSNDGKNFTDIGKIISHSTQGQNSYQFEDASPFSGNNYYRIRIVDRDMQSSYSSIIMIHSANILSQLSIYPNPAKSVLNLKFTLNKQEIINLQIIDASGKLMNQKTIHANTGINNTSINVEKLSNGVYFLESEINGLKERTTFVKN